MELSSLRTFESARVFKDRTFAGILSRTAAGARFEYDEEFRRAALSEGSYGLSFSLSPSKQIHEVAGVNLHPFFARLLPEGLRLKALRHVLKTSEDDLFTMLLALGTNCIGDIYIAAEEKAGDAFIAPKMSEVSFLELFEKSRDTRAI